MRIETVLVADDEPLARERLRALLESIPEVREIRECRDGEETVAALREGGADLLFLDVQMPGLDGLQVLDALRRRELPPVVFVTAYDHYALEAFERHAVDYLLKPFDDERFHEAFERARRRLESDDLARIRDGLDGVLQVVQRYREPPAHVIVEKGERLVVVPTGRIDWMESEGNYVRLHAGDTSYLVRGTLGSVRDRLKSERFLQIHRAYVVAVDSVREIQRLFNGRYRVLLRDGTELPVSRRYARRLPVLG